MTNQLQKDIKIALSWKAFLPYEKTYKQDNEAFKRLEHYSKKELGYETYPKLQQLADKYHFNISDTADILEEYILIDNEVIEQKNIEHMIKEAYENERTELGRSVLKQLLESLE